MAETEFKKTIGHDKIKKLFLQGAAEGRLKQSYALVGSAHVGKTTFALELAEILGAHPVLDVILHDENEREGELGIEEARKLQAMLSLSPVGRFKVGIIGAAEKMTREAGNSLLKFLEEPAPRALIFLITNNIGALLPTIASRVQKINFGKNTEQEIQTALREHEVTGRDITRLARGRIGLAIRMAADETLLAFQVRTEELYGTFLRGSIADRLQSSATLAESRVRLGEFLEYAMERQVADGGSVASSRKLLSAWRELPLNLNLKLAADCLFLPAK